MKIYAVGDSFTAGSELVDHKYYSDFPGYTTAMANRPGNPYNEWYRKKPWLHRVVGGHSSPAYHEVLEEEKSLTYANQLGSILDLPVVNQGIGGCSLDTIVRNLVLYLDTINEPHVVFFQPTSNNRWCQYYEHTWRDFIAGNPENNVSKDFESWMKLKVMLEDDYSWTMRWWMNLKTALAVMQSNPWVKQYYVVESGNLRWQRTDVIHHADKYATDDLGSRVLKFINEEINPRRIDFPFTADEPVICPGGHFNHVVHRRLAEQLVEKIKSHTSN